MQKFDAEKDYYQVLGISCEATSDEIEKAYRNRARRLHPDSGGSEEEMKELNEAHDLLSDPETRIAYDDQRHPPVIAFGSSYAFDVESSAKVGAFEAQGDDEGLSGALISSATGLLLGTPFLILVESQWFFFLWPLRIMAFGLIGFGILMANSALTAYQRRVEKVGRKRSRLTIVAQKGLFWLTVCAFFTMIFIGLYSR